MESEKLEASKVIDQQKKDYEELKRQLQKSEQDTRIDASTQVKHLEEQVRKM